MPTKEEIKANKAEAKALRKTLTAANRETINLCKKYRNMIRHYSKAIETEEKKHSNYTAKVNRRLAILEGRNEA